MRAYEYGDQEQFVYSIGHTVYKCEDCKKQAIFGYINYIQAIVRCPWCGGNMMIERHT